MKNNRIQCYKEEEYNDFLGKILNIDFEKTDIKFAAKSMTFQVTEDCNLRCTYCYQHAKTKKRMSFDTAKKYIDLILTDDKSKNNYFTKDDCPGIILDFIGGEPTLEIELIDKIVDYMRQRTMELNHSWKDNFRVSFATNGTLYFTEAVQKFVAKHKPHLSISVSLDGNKELHDSCRLFPDGTGSYDIASAAAKDLMRAFKGKGTKVTICPANVSHLYEASRHMVELGYTSINANCVFEEGWELKDAKILYKELKKFADYLLSLDDGECYYYGFFQYNDFAPIPSTENQNWCGGVGDMISCDPDGNIYPCTRYAPTSLGDKQKPLVIGHVDSGILVTKEQQAIDACFKCITRRSQSTDECFNCSIGRGCAWCSAYNYEVFGTANKRATFICDCHRAASLANVYYWNKTYRKLGMDERFKMHLEKDIALTIIDQAEYDMLKTLEGK